MSELRRRAFLRATGVLGVGGMFLGGRALTAGADDLELPFANGNRKLVSFPQKRPMILLTTRPPQLETPFLVFNEGIFTPNDAFFVRYHLANIPTSINPDQFTLSIKGRVNHPLTLSLADLRTKFEAVEIVAVNQCSGNGRGFSNPRVAGGQAGNGLMGNARWKGVSLRSVLDKAGVQEGARQVTFNGLDQPAISDTPDFLKALDIDHARDGEVMLAYEMNGTDLPVLNGFPVRLIVPGHYGTYWVKHVSEITVIDNVFNGFWMSSAYRIPANACACLPPGGKAAATVPINRYNVRSFITNLTEGAQVRAGGDLVIKGIAFDGGYGITEVAVSVDGGQSWQAARLGEDLGRYSFREWQTAIRVTPGTHALKVRATNRIGQSQPMEALWNPPGYMRNVVESVTVNAV